MLTTIGGPETINDKETYSLNTETQVVRSELENVTVLDQNTLKRSLCTNILDVGGYVCEGIYVYNFTDVIPFQQTTPTCPPLNYILSNRDVSSVIVPLFLPNNMKLIVANE